MRRLVLVVFAQFGQRLRFLGHFALSLVADNRTLVLVVRIVQRYDAGSVVAFFGKKVPLGVGDVAGE